MLPSLEDPKEAYVTELSSFMLSYGKYRFFRGAVTNVSENHLNWHKDFSEYISAKLSVFRRAEETVLNADDNISAEFFKDASPFATLSSVFSYKELKKLYRSQVFYTAEEGFIRRCGDPIMAISDLKRKERHNLSNFLTALALTDGYVSRERIREVGEGFSGLAHRAELFLSLSGMDFIDSSIDSTPKRTAVTLESLARRVIVILGGRGKNLSYEPLKAPLSKWANLAIICGENGDEIEYAIRGCCKTLRATDPEEGARLALGLMKEGDTLLLSPASTSFDRYKSFEERGEKFKDTIRNALGV
jgi:UDP-N-acetylmuramoylalanine--D-glutamate ligase